MEKFDDLNDEHISKDWKVYLDTVHKVNPLLKKAFDIIEKEQFVIKTAFDIGCGPGNESNYLINKGCSVSAFDYNKECIIKIKELFPDIITNTKFKFILSRIENIKWEKVDLIVSVKVLPFLEKQLFYSAIENIKKSINKSGIIVLSLFGENDDWKKCSLVSKKEIETIFKDFEFLHFKEKQDTVKTVSGFDKKGHLFELVLKLK